MPVAHRQGAGPPSCKHRVKSEGGEGGRQGGEAARCALRVHSACVGQPCPWAASESWRRHCWHQCLSHYHGTSCSANFPWTEAPAQVRSILENEKIYGCLNENADLCQIHYLPHLSGSTSASVKRMDATSSKKRVMCASLRNIASSTAAFMDLTRVLEYYSKYLYSQQGSP